MKKTFKVVRLVAILVFFVVMAFGFFKYTHAPITNTWAGYFDKKHRSYTENEYKWYKV